MKILVAEKDPFYRSLISKRLLGRRYEIVEVAESKDVLRVLDREKIDLVLLSAEMEAVEGKLLIEMIRKKPNLISVPVILLTGEDEISDLVMTQARGYDDFLLKPFNSLVLQLRVAINIAKAHQRVEVNPLTHLPGNASIERVILKKIETGEKFSVLYIDVDHFKSFNDRYGFEKGDEVLRRTAEMLVQTAEDIAGEASCFIGHIGGDDFVVVLSPEYEESYARTFIARFDRVVPAYYNQDDQKRGKIRVTNRRGRRESFPIMSCSIAACNNLHYPYKNVGEIARDAAEVKSFLKTQPGSHYLRDRRSAPIPNLQEALDVLEPDVRSDLNKGKLKDHTQPLGQILLHSHLIDRDQLTIALRRHKRTGIRIGRVLVAMQTLSAKDLGAVLSKQLKVPYFSLQDFHPDSAVVRLLTREFIQAHRVLPLAVKDGELKLGMCHPEDTRTIDAVRILTELNPSAVLLLDDEFQNFLDRTFHQNSIEEKAG